MPRITQSVVKKILTEKLSLKKPEFRLRTYAQRVCGHIISQTFFGKGDHRRQEMIWDALETEFGKDVRKHIGMLLTYTPAEWHIDDIMTDRPRSKAS
jgi:acid stress-induced BolA-like protein IbaG/YrbA